MAEEMIAGCDVDPTETFLLNKLTGRVHEYDGTAPGGVGGEPGPGGIGIRPCGCDDGLFEEAVTSGNEMLINGRHLEAGVWEPAPCLLDDESNDSDESSESDDKPDGYTMIEECGEEW